MSFINIITWVNLYISIVLVLFFGLTKLGNKPTNKITLALLTVFTVLIFFTFSVSKYAAEYYMSYQKVLFITYQVSFLIGPLIYLYFKSHLFGGKFSWLSLFHLIPIIAAISYLLIYYTKVEYYVYWMDKSFKYIVEGILIHILCYLFFVVYLFYKAKENPFVFIRDISISDRFELGKIIILAYIFFWVIGLHSMAIYMLYINPDFCAYSASIWGFFSFLFINIALLSIIFKPSLILRKEKYRYSSLNSYDKNNIIKLLNNYLHEQKTYLHSEISLKKVSDELSISGRFVSQAINETYSVNFRNYINQLRIKYCIELLSNESHNSYTISEIMYDSGFNSKSVFHTLFKEITAMTPKEFRESKKKVRKPVYEP